MKLPDDSPVLKVFTCLGEINIPSELDEDKLPADVAALEEFVCNVYSENGPKTLSELSWELFRTKNSEGEMLPQRLEHCYHTPSEPISSPDVTSPTQQYVLFCLQSRKMVGIFRMECIHQ